MKLYAISDIHCGYKVNREAIESMPAHPDDWLILAGDVGETAEHLNFAFDTLGPRFAKLIWVPGNHELWTIPRDPAGLRGEAKYQSLVALCRSRGVLTPEDPFPVWPGDGPPCVLAPLFLLYDYTFRPDSVPPENARDWALESGIRCADELVLHPDPHPTLPAWCAARCEVSESRLQSIPQDAPTVLINHFPMLSEHAWLPFIPRFSIWCGTRRTADWHLRFRAHAVVYGHLHIPKTRWADGVRFEEVSLGYPHQWNQRRPIQHHLREILPGDYGR